MNTILYGHESLAGDRLSRIITELGHTSFVNQGDYQSLLTAIKHRRPEVVVLSTALPELPKLCARLCQDDTYLPAIVLIGKEDDVSAAQAFAMGVSHYLVSPVAVDDMSAMFTKIGKLTAAQAWQLNHKNSDGKSVRHHIAARTHRGVEMVSLADVYYFAADQKYVKVRHKQGTVLIDETLKDLEEEFGERMFRIHRGALVNLEYLDLLESVGGGQYQVRFRGVDETLPVSRRHLPALREKIHSI